MFGEKLRQLRENNHLTQEQLAIKLGVSDKTVSSWEINRTEPNMNMVQKIAIFFDVKIDELLKDTINNISPELTTPILHNITPLFDLESCGYGSWQNEQPIDYIALPDTIKLNKHKKYYAHIAYGNSMINAGIKPGDILVFEECNVPQENMIGSFALEDNMATCKRFKTVDGKAYLMPANNDYVPIEFTENMRMIGMLAFVIKDYREMEEE